MFGFACTGSSYLVGAGEEERLVSAAEAAYGYRVATAARAIVWGLERLRARRIAMIAPYPEALAAKAREYWSDAGLQVVRSLHMPTATTDTRGIYALGSERLAAALEEVSIDGVDAVVVLGTGLASLPAICDSALSVPVISSNVCLAGLVVALTGHAELLEPDSPFLRGWRARLGEALNRL